MKITYGHTVRSTDELYVRLAEEAGTDTVTSGSPGSVLVDFFPARMSQSANIVDFSIQKLSFSFSKTYTHLDARSRFQATRPSDPNQGPYYARYAI
jgi:hypothetical protein